MTREEAKAWFKVLLKDEYAFNSADREAFAMAIKALEQEPCEDAINREDALMALTGEWTEITDEIIHRFIKRIKALPPVNPQPKIGHWINGDCKGGNCSICGEYYAFYPESGDFNYCPNCGAKMSEIPTGSDPQESEKVN